VQVAKRIVATDIPVLYIELTPEVPEHALDCLAKEAARRPESPTFSACGVGKEEALKISGPVEAAASMYPLMRQLSFNDVFCPNDSCPPVIGNVVVYRDKHHLTAAFAQSLAAVLEGRLVDALPQLKRNLSDLPL